jgi:hypothetical protein
VGRFLIYGIAFVVVLYAFIDVVLSRGDDVRSLPKPLWAILVLVLPLLGALGWFVWGRPRAAGNGGGLVPGSGPVAPDDPAPSPDRRDLVGRCRRERRRRHAGRRHRPHRLTADPPALVRALHRRRRRGTWFGRRGAGDVPCFVSQDDDQPRTRHRRRSAWRHPAFVYTGSCLLLLAIGGRALADRPARAADPVGVRVPDLRRDLGVRSTAGARSLRWRW